MARVSETAASLRIVGDELDPAEVTRLLGRPPELGYRRGDAVPLRGGKQRIAREGLWSIGAERASPGDLDAQIARLLGSTTADLTVWSDLSSRYRADLFCGLFVRDGNQGLVISPATLLALGQRGIELDLDIYAVGGND